MRDEDRLAGYSFISYVREDAEEVDQLQRMLEAAGIQVWRDTASLWPGEDWRARIRHAITEDALVFIACFSSKSLARKKSYQNEELVLAIDQLRLRRPDVPWLIPVRLDDCSVPDHDIGGGRTLASIQCADLFGDRSGEAAARLVASVRRILGQRSGALPAVGWPRPGAMAGRLVRIAPRPVYLVGREQLLADLQGRLSGEGNEAGPQIVALCGLGGAGKTSVAVEYAHRHLAETGLAWQFPAEDATALAAGFDELARQLGAGDLPDLGDPVTRVHGILGSWPGRWLLIFDNAPDAAALQSVLPPAGNGQVLITTQNPLWPGRRAIEIPVLDQDVAAEFLVTRTGDDAPDAAWELAGELGGLPLALEQSAAYMQAAGRSIAAYLGLFRIRRDDLLSRGEPAGYSRQVATTWSLAFGQLREHEPQAAGLLQLLACCAAEAIPLHLLLQPRPELAESLPAEARPVLAPLAADPLAADAAIAALRRYSLISPPAHGSVSMHRLVQAVTLSQLIPAQRAAWRQAAGSLIEAALPSDPQDPATWPAYAALMPHARATLGSRGEVMKSIIGYLGHSGNYAAARILSEQLLETCEQEPGADHPDTLDARADLARWTGEAGDPAGARDQLADLLPVRERVSGAEHPDTLGTRHQIAGWIGEAGDPTTARDQYAELLPVMERVLGPEHPRTLTIRHNLASWIADTGDPAGARDQYAELLPARERVSGPEHPNTLICRLNLARWTGEAGDPAAARDQLADLLPIRERVSGPEHPRTVATRDELNRWTQAARSSNAE